jgi:prepilin-type processing-associated H-X9-DG protein
MSSPPRPSPESTPPSPEKPLQFSLRFLLALPIVLALLFASIAWAGGAGAVLFVFVASLAYTICVPAPADARCRFRRQFLWAVPLWFVVLFCGGATLDLFILPPLLFVAFCASVVFFFMGLALPSLHWFCAATGTGAMVILLLLPFVSHGGGAARRVQCSNNLKQIGLALHNYHDIYGRFPPAYVADADGRRLYSWRVLILPFIEQKPLYDQFRLDEPWDSPANLPLSQTEIYVFCCPSDEASGTPASPGMTNYLAIVGPWTMWPEAASRSFADFTDGMSNSLAVVEVRDSGIHWAEPRDLHVDQMTRGVNPAAGQGISSGHEGGANVLIADGSVRFLKSDTPAATLEALLSIAGGEKISQEP